MKRKVILGFGAIALIFVLCGIFIYSTLSEVYFGDEFHDNYEKILNRYDRILYHVKDTQEDIYALEAGHQRQKELLKADLSVARNLLSLTAKDYALYSSKALCRHCHVKEKAIGENSFADDRIGYHQGELGDISNRIGQYREKLPSIAASRNGKAMQALVREAQQDGDEIIARLNRVRNATKKMVANIEAAQLSLIRRSIYSIIIAIMATVVLSVTILVVTVRSITKPVDLLIHGIKGVSAGDYSSKVTVQSDDEIGFIARSFNTMTDNLDRVTRQREALMGELRELNNNLERRVHEAAEELKTAHESMVRSEALSLAGTFAAGVAHELATPLASARGYFRMVKTSIAEQGGLARDIDLIEGELQRCSTILAGMLNIAREPEKEMELTDINAVIRDVLALVKYQPENKKSIVVREDLDIHVPQVMAVAGHIRQVFLNVIVNAIQSMPKGGELDIKTSLAAEGKEVLVTISDTGLGIPAEDLDRVFQPFYTGRKDGSGLGLSISYGIVKFHGGDIKVKSEQGKGTVFSIYLPVQEMKEHNDGQRAIGNREKEDLPQSTQRQFNRQ